MFQNIFTIINQGWVGSLIGFVGIVVGILGIFSYRISKSRGIPSIQKYSLRIIGKGDKEVEEDIVILYKGDKVERLTKTIIVFWNSGTETINGADIIQSDPISFSFSDDARIVSQKFLKISRSVINPKLSTAAGVQNASILEFEFMDPHDGVTIEFLHTDKNRYPSISGTIKGVPSGISDEGIVLDSIRSTKSRFDIVFRSPRKLMYFAIALGLIAIGIGVLPESLFERLSSDEPGPLSAQWFFIIFGATYSSSAAFVLWKSRRKHPRILEVPGAGS